MRVPDRHKEIQDIESRMRLERIANGAPRFVGQIEAKIP
jgi:hypothetical protein